MTGRLPSLQLRIISLHGSHHYHCGRSQPGCDWRLGDRLVQNQNLNFLCQIPKHSTSGCDWGLDDWVVQLPRRRLLPCLSHPWHRHQANVSSWFLKSSALKGHLFTLVTSKKIKLFVKGGWTSCFLSAWSFPCLPSYLSGKTIEGDHDFFCRFVFHWNHSKFMTLLSTLKLVKPVSKILLQNGRRWSTKRGLSE